MNARNFIDEMNLENNKVNNLKNRVNNLENINKQ